MIVKRDSVCRRPPQGEPYGLRSQIVYYVDQNDETIAVVHQYLRPDGSLAGSGRPDPKHLLLGNRRLHVRRSG